MGGRIRWLFGECAYEIMYTDEEGQRHRTYKSFKVLRTNAFGGMLGLEEFQKARLLTLGRARALWNTLDQSLVARYSVDLVGDAGPRGIPESTAPDVGQGASPV